MSASSNSTCIVGIADKNGVYLAGDTLGSNSRLQKSLRSDVKVFRNGEMILGGTTSFRMLNLLQCSLKIPRQSQGQDDFEFMVNDFVEAVRKCFAEGGFIKKGRDGQDQGGSFLVGYHGQLWGIYDDFQVALNSDNYASVGCGEDIALGSLFTTRNLKMAPKERLRAALDAASHHSAGVSGPYTFEEILNNPKKKKT